MTAGRPRKFETVEELDQMAEAYFASCVPHLVGEQVIQEPPTAYGLSIACGTTWETMRDYRSGKYDTDDAKFSLAVKWWVEQVKHFAEKGLYNARNAAGPIFHLINLTKNDGDARWVNAQSTEHTGKDGKDLFPEMTDEQLNARILAALPKA